MSDICKNWSQWLKQSRFSYMSEEQKEQTINWLQAIKNAVLANAALEKTDIVIDIGTGTGLLAFGAMDVGCEKVIFSDKFEDCLVSCKEILDQVGVSAGYEMLQSACEEINLPDEAVDKALMRSVLVHILDKQTAINEVFRILKKGGKFCAFEPIIASNTRYHELLTPENIENYEEFKKVEDEFMSNQSDPLCNFDENSLAKNLDDAGFSDGVIDLQVVQSEYVVNKDMVETWFNTPPSPDQPTMRERFEHKISQEKVAKFIQDVKNDLSGRNITIKSNTVFITAIK